MTEAKNPYNHRLDESLDPVLDPSLEFSRMDEEAVRIGKEMLAITQTDAWRRFQLLARRRVVEVGEMAMIDMDTEKPRGVTYWKGFRDGARAFEALTDYLVEAARAGEASRRAEADVAGELNLGSGPASVGEF